MGATLVTPKTTSGGEIIRELVNASDGQGLHFDGSAGGINLGTSMPDLGTKYSLEFVVKGDSKTGETYLLDAYKSGARIIFGWSGYSNGNIQLHINGTWSSAFMATPDNGQVVHLVLSVDGTSATLYQNGNSVSTQTVVANTMTSATSTHIGCSQNGTANYFNGTIYRARFYNKALTSAEVQTAYERADVDYSSQYGSETNLVNPAANGDFSGSGNWVGQGNHSASIVSGELQVVASGASNGSSNAATLAATYGGTGTNGKVYKWEFTARASSGTPTLRARTPFDHSDVTTGSYKDFVLSTSNQTFSITGKRIALENAYFGLLEAGTFFIDNIKATQIGAVSDYDLAFANPTQSRMVQDRAGVADGTASTSGVTQVQPIIQGNLTSLRVGSGQTATPADNQVLVDGGTVGAPAYAFAHTTNTGMWSRGGGKLDFTTGGVTRIAIDADGNISLPTAGQTIKTDLSSGGTTRTSVIELYNNTTGALSLKTDNGATGGIEFWTEGTKRLDVTRGGAVHVGATHANEDQTSSLIISKSIASSGTHDYITLADTSNNGTEKLRLLFKGRYATGSHANGQEAAYISCNRDAGSDGYGLSFGTGDAADAVDRLTISRIGHVAIGDDKYYQWGGTNARIVGSHSGDYVKILTGNSAKLTVNSAGLATFSNGIAFSQTNTSATGATATGTTLDHYEEGTWTCTLNGVTGGNTTAYYTRVGDIVTVYFYSGSMTSDGSAAHISGLPFTVSGAAYGGFFCFHNTYAPTANSGYFSVGTTTGNFTAANATATASSANATGRYLMFTGVYKAA